MGRASENQHSLNAGELSSLLLGRQDIQKYGSGLFTCFNSIPLAQGAWTRRPGTGFLGQTKFNTKLSRIIPFQYSVLQTYQLEFGDLYVRFYSDHDVLTLTPQNITGISNASTAVLTYSGSDTYANGDRVIVKDVVGMTQVNNREFKVANVNTGSNTFELNESDDTPVDSTNYDTYVSGGTVAEIYEVTTTYTESMLAGLNFTQSADTLYIFSATKMIATLTRTTATTFTLSTLTLVDGPYDVTNTTATTLTPSGATGTGVTLTASAITGINGGVGFKSTDVGRLIRIQEGTTWGYVLVTAFTDTTHVTVTVINTLTNTSAKANWRLGIWSDTTGYPTCGTFHEDRLWAAGATGYPQRIDGSKSGNYTSFQGTSTAGVVADDNAIAYTLNSEDVNAVKWLQSTDKALLVGTARGEWPVRASTATSPLTPTDISAKPATHYGSASIAAIQAGRATLFVQRAGRKMRELAYVFEIDGFRAPDLTILAEHISRPGIVGMTYQEQPQPIVWAWRSDGVLVGMTYDRDQDVVAWHRHELGGQSDSAGDAIPVVESACVTASPDATRDEVFMIVQRYINGKTRRCVEYMTKIWETGDEQDEAVYADASWTQVNGSPSMTVTGLFHLEGETVGVYADGAKLPEQVVTNGKITLNRAATTVTVGYWYNSDGQTMPLEGGAQDGSAQAKLKRINRVGFWLVDTLGFQYGRNADNLTEQTVRKWGDEYGSPPSLFTGVIRETLESDWDKLAQVYWRCNGPFPATVLSYMPQVDVSDDS